MKKYWIILFVFSLFIASCSNDDEEDLVGDWWKSSGLDGVARSEAVGFVINDKFYIGTGYDGDDRLTDFWEYNPTTDYWTRKADFPGTARNGAVGIAVNGKGYVGTGYDGDNALNDFYEYDPETNVWTKIQDFPGIARYDAVTFAIGDKLYVGTGKDDDKLLYKDFYAYNTSTQAWEDVNSLRGDKRSKAAAFTLDGIGYVISGYSSGYENDMWAYNPSSDSWTEMRKISNYTDDDFDNDYSNIARADGSTFTINGRGYLVCGTNGSLVNNVWEYDPVQDLWTERTEFEGSSRTEAVGFSAGSYGYIVTGRSSSYYFYDLWTFDPFAEYSEEY